MKILYVTTVSLTINSFFRPHIAMLVREGHQVDIACNCKDLPLDPLFDTLGCRTWQVDFSRSPLSPDNLRAWGQLRRIVADGAYDIVHCHTPNASVITRLVCRSLRRRTGLRVFYTAHGFHFYRGAPLASWLIFYPIEKLCSRFTDKLIAINREDFLLAKTRFHAKEVCYVPGVGVDLSRFEDIRVDHAAKRREIGVPEDAVMLLSVGELNENKNHRIILKALAGLRDPNVHYVIAGSGQKRDDLRKQAQELGVSGQVHLLGYRKDVPELYPAADVYCLPSFREGLSLSLMEAMAAGMPCVVSRIRGNLDLIDEEGGCTFDPHDEVDCRKAIHTILRQDRKHMGAYNREKIKPFGLSSVQRTMRRIYFGDA